MKRALFCLALALAARTASASLAVQRHVLPNGLTVILYEDRKLPLVTTYVWYKVGSADEAPGKSGFAHLFEHFMFEGSQNVPSGTILKLGDRGCYANASTSFDRTDYVISCPSQNLEELLRLESDRMGFLEPGMTRQNFEKQRGIVLNEKRQRGNQPYASAGEALFRGAFPPGHPYSNLPIGSEEDLNASSIDDAKRFHGEYYWPNNAVLVISGDHDSVQTLRLVDKWFGGLKSGPVPPRPVDLSGAPSGPRQELTDDKAPLPLLIMAWRVPGAGRPGSTELSALGGLLAGGRASPLVQNLTIKRQVLLDISADADLMHHGGLFMIQATPAPGVSLKDAELAVEAELAAALAQGLDGARLKGMAKRLETARLDALQSAERLVSTLADGEALKGDPLAFEGDIAAFEKLDAESVRQAGLKYLVPANRSTLTISPKGAR